jgi:Uma2 family endonuclease
VEPQSSSRAFTVDDLYAMPDDGRVYEIEAGLLVSEPLPSPRHGRVVAALAELLRRHVRSRGLGVVLAADAGFLLAREPDTLRGPDVSFVARERYLRLEDESRAFPGPPDLAIEVLSPGNTPAALHGKVADYLAAGARLVWLVDPERQCVTVYRSLLAPRTLPAEGELDGEDVLPGFRARVADIFEV